MTGTYIAGRPLWKIEKPYEVILSGIVRLIIPAGFEFDYASVPRPFWMALPPADPRYGAASLLHDFLCSNAIFSWSMNADMFSAALKYWQVNPLQNWIMTTAVRCAGIANPYADIDEIIGYRGQCGIYEPASTGPVISHGVPLFDTIEELASYAKTRTREWVIPV